MPNKNYEFVFQISGNKGYKDITIFLERESYCSDESKRTSPSMNISELLEFEGSFWKLDVD